MNYKNLIKGGFYSVLLFSSLNSTNQEKQISTPSRPTPYHNLPPLPDPSANNNLLQNLPTEVLSEIQELNPDIEFQPHHVMQNQTLDDFQNAILAKFWQEKEPSTIETKASILQKKISSSATNNESYGIILNKVIRGISNDCKKGLENYVQSYRLPLKSKFPHYSENKEKNLINRGNSRLDWYFSEITKAVVTNQTKTSKHLEARIILDWATKNLSDSKKLKAELDSAIIENFHTEWKNMVPETPEECATFLLTSIPKTSMRDNETFTNTLTSFFDNILLIKYHALRQDHVRSYRNALDIVYPSHLPKKEESLMQSIAKKDIYINYYQQVIEKCIELATEKFNHLDSEEIHNIISNLNIGPDYSSDDYSSDGYDSDGYDSE